MLFTSAIVTRASGSLGGITAARNASGQYFRARSNPVNPSTPQQQDIRAAMSLMSQRYVSGLTEAQREAWRTYALNVSTNNKLGEAINLSAIAMYCRCNVPRVQAGLAIVDDGPEIYNLGDEPSLSVSEFSAGDPYDITLDINAGTGTWEDQDDANLLVYASRQRAPSVVFFKGPFRFVSALAGNSTTAPTEYSSSAGFAGAAGNIVTVQARVTYGDGRLSSAVRLTDTVV